MSDTLVADPPVASAESTEASGSGRRGRPRPEVTVERDTKSMEFFQTAGANGLTRENLAEQLGVKASEAYLSIYRLSRRNPAVIGKVRVDGKTVWKLAEFITDTPSETPTEAPAE